MTVNNDRNDPNLCIASLAALGFTDLEAEVYIFLLQQPVATGYRIAQGIEKPTANTYKAIESLQKKGAILVDDGAKRQYRPVPAEELLNQLERGFAERKARAASALAQIPRPADDERVYQLRSHQQVMERCCSMLARCTEVAILDIFPGPLSDLRADIERAAARGVVVALQAYQPCEVMGAEVILISENVLKNWPGQWLNIVIDGSEHLLAFLTQDGKEVHQAVWSGSAYLSWIYHCTIGCELTTAVYERHIDNGDGPEILKEAKRRCWRFLETKNRGYRTLMERYGEPHAESNDSTELLQ